MASPDETMRLNSDRQSTDGDAYPCDLEAGRADRVSDDPDQTGVEGVGIECSTVGADVGGDSTSTTAESCTSGHSSMSGNDSSPDKLAARSCGKVTPKDSAATPPENVVDPRKNCLSKAKSIFRPYAHGQNALAYYFALRLMLENRREMNCTPDESSTFSAHSFFRKTESDPSLFLYPLRFVQRVSTAMQCKYTCYVLSLIYIDRLLEKFRGDLPFNIDTIDRIALISVVVASKFFDDLYYSNLYYASQLGYKLEVLNFLEVCFLIALDFDLAVNPQLFRKKMEEFYLLRAILQNPWPYLKFPANTDAGKLGIRASTLLSSFPALQKYAILDGSGRFDGTARFETEAEYLYRVALTAKSKTLLRVINDYQIQFTINHSVKYKDCVGDSMASSQDTHRIGDRCPETANLPETTKVSGDANKVEVSDVKQGEVCDEFLDQPVG